MQRIGWLGLGFVGLVGCAAYPVQPAPPVVPAAGAARICVIRTSDLDFAAPLTVHDNDRLMGASEPATYFCYLAEPGAHVVTSVLGDELDRFFATGETARATLAAVAGARYYLVQDFDEGGSHRLVWIDEAMAGEVMRGCAPVWLSRVPAGEMLPMPHVAAPALALEPRVSAELVARRRW